MGRDIGKWGCMEKGWYIHPVLGGLCYESAATSWDMNLNGPGWYFWPRTIAKDKKEWYGPFDTMTAAMKKAQKRRVR